MLHHNNVLPSSPISGQFEMVPKVNEGKWLIAELEDAFSASRVVFIRRQFHTLHHLLHRDDVGFVAHAHAEALDNRQCQRKTDIHRCSRTMLAADLHAAAKRLHITAYNVQSDTPAGEFGNFVGG